MSTPARDLPAVLRRRAAVLVDFELGWLGVDFSRESAGEALPGFLRDDVRPVSGPEPEAGSGDAAPRWRAHDRARESAARDGFDALREAWGAVERRPEHPLQAAIDALFDGGFPLDPGGRMRVDRLDRGALEAMAQVSRWFDGAGAPVPEYATVEQILRYELMLDPLREVATRFFRDRKKERKLLAKPARGEVKMIVGRGGIGKTALIAAHLLDAAQSGTLVVSLTFDHRALDPSEPETMVAEISRQLLLQTASPLMRRRPAGRQSDRSSTATRDVRIFDDETWARELRSLASRVGRPVIVVFDTIEEAQRRDWALTNLRKIMQLCAGIAQWEVIGSGRAPVAGLATTIELAGLPEDDAVLLLRDLIGAERRLSDAELRHVVSLVSTSPLCVRLAAGILRSAAGDLDALSDLELRRGAIEGELYRRLLGHIEDPDVQKLAYPGLTLRRITPDLIRQVLARPCKVSVPDDGRAQELFAGLAQEAMLVEQGEPGEIIHRSDIRPMMIERLADDEKKAVRSIHRAAIAYYRQRSDTQSRVEELYHRLMLGQSARTIDPRMTAPGMTDEAVTQLVEVADEFPPQSRRYLTRFSSRIELSDADLQALDDDDRRATVEKQVRQLVSGGQVGEALALLEAMPARDGSPLLPLVELQVRELAGELERALRIGREEERRRSAKGDTAGAVEAALHCARLQERLGQTDAAARSLAALARTAAGALPRGDDPVTLLRLVVARLRLVRLGAHAEHREDLVAEALDLFARIPASTLRREPALLRDLAGELDKDVPLSILTAALDAGEVSDDDGSLLSALSAFDAKVSKARGKADGVLTERLRRSDEVSVDEALEDLVAPEAPASATADFISDAIKEYGAEAPEELSDSLTRHFRGASDRANDFTIEEP